MASFFYFNSLSSWKWTFPEGLGGLCHTCGNSEGVGGHQFPAKMENPGRWGGPKWNSLRGGGLDIFWNYTFRKTCQVTLSDHFNTVDFHEAQCYLRCFSLIWLNSGLRIEEQLFVWNTPDAFRKKFKPNKWLLFLQYSANNNQTNI